MELGGAYVILWAAQAKVFKADFISSTSKPYINERCMKDASSMSSCTS